LQGSPVVATVSEAFDLSTEEGRRARFERLVELYEGRDSDPPRPRSIEGAGHMLGISKQRVLQVFEQHGYRVRKPRVVTVERA
jgi:hypothetical protein